MKKFFTLILLLLGVTVMNAKTVTTSTALQVGSNYLMQHGVPLARLNNLKLVYTSGTSAASAFYVFSTNNCFVMVAADDGVIPVLAYSTNRAFHAEKIPVNVAEFIQSYSNQINYVITNNIAGTPEIATRWDNLIHNKTSGAAERTMSVAPLLNTIWNQEPYYNDSCPGTPGALAVTGCVATATAQVMKYWNWPVSGQGSHSYNSANYGTLSADFGATTYNWSAMLDSISGDNPAIATLMYHVGVSVDMGYGTDESSAYVISSASPIVNCTQYALPTYFNYNASTIQGLSRSNYSNSAWIALIENDLSNNRPVIYTGFGSAGGHCFVADGFDGSNNIHMNWGWGGYGPDGYYAIDALNPPALGTGGGSGGFNSGQQAVIGIQPNSVPPAGTYTLALNNNVNQSAVSITYGNSFTDSTSVYNSGSVSFTGDFCAAAFDNSGALVAMIDSVTGVTITSMTASPNMSFPTAGLLTLLPGNYNIGIFYRPTGGNWQIVANSGSYTNLPLFTVTNYAYMELDDTMLVTSGALVQGSPATVTLNLYDSSTTAFSGSLDVSLYDLDGNVVSTIQTLSGISIPASGTYSTSLTFSTTSVTATPGTYLMALQFDDGTGYALAGSDFHKNPILVTVQAATLPPDIYEPNNSISTAYLLPLTFTGEVASVATTGSNINDTSDQDYYKIQLPVGYEYLISALVDDDLNTYPPYNMLDYTTAVVWSYSTDSINWSPVYSYTMAGSINVTPTVSDTTVFFHVSPMYPGNTGTYLFQIYNVTRFPDGIATIDPDDVRIYPNPVTDYLNIDFSGTPVRGTSISIYDAIGQKVYSAAMNYQTQYRIATEAFADGLYFVEIATDQGVVRRKISINR